MCRGGGPACAAANGKKRPNPNVGRPKASLELSDDGRATLSRWSRRWGSSQALATRSRIVLASAEGLTNVAVAAGAVSRRTRWRSGGAGSWNAAWMDWGMTPGRDGQPRSPPARLRTSWLRHSNPHRRTPCIGRGRRWPNGPGSRSRRSDGSGGPSSSSPTGLPDSSSPTTPCSSRRSTTWSVYI